MGLSIFYSGKIRDMKLLPALTEEVIDICDNMHWIYGYLKPDPEIPLAGFHFHPEGSEPVWLTFRDDGVLADPVYYIFKDDTFSPPLPEPEYQLTTVTQFAGMDAHMALVKLLKYLSRKYFDDFELIDESESWETGDEALCMVRFDYFTIQMDEMAIRLSALDGQYGLTGESIRTRMDNLLLSHGINKILKALE